MIHPQVLPAEQTACLRLLAPVVTPLGFHLGGGTAVALLLGHRRSVDFDWFVGRFPGRPVELRESLAAAGIDLQVTAIAEQTVHGSIAGVKVSFFEFRPALLEPLAVWTEMGCQLASCSDLAAMKLLAVAQRGTKKDFIDLHALSRKMSLVQMLGCYQRRFGVTDTGRLLASLCFFDDAESEPMPTMLTPLRWEAVKQELQQMVRQVARGTDGGPG